jgi:phosphoglycerol transferase MdoB-like AlkP superfamily enzyme
MAEQTVQVPTAPRLARLGTFARAVRTGEKIRPETTYGLAALVVALLLRHFWLDEGTLTNILFVAGVTAGIIAVLLLASRRILFAVGVAALIVGLIVTTSAAKQRIMNMVVHAYDLVFYLSSPSTLAYLWSDQRRYVVAFLVGLAVMSALAVLLFRADPSRIPRRWSAFALALAIIAAWAGAAAKGERRHMQFYFENLYVSSFYASWGETIEALMRGAILEASPKGAAASILAQAGKCQTGTKPPHIILIHAESVVQPSLFPTVRYDRSLDPYFQSDDKALHQLRVETYGGASWLTEFSILAGVSTHSFGGMRQFVQTFTQNRLKETLPQVLAGCGYRNVVFYPMLRNFVSNDRFYGSIGLKEIFDMKSQAAPTAQERDRFYFDNALNEIDRHLKTSRQPMFTYVQTMAAHWPYTFKYAPEENVPGGAPGTPPEMDEYLRRLSLTKIDFDHLMSELKKRFPGESFLVVHYGDHHPTATRTYLGFGDETEAEDVTLTPDSPGFLTYFAARGINYQVPKLPPFETLDVPYLGTSILEMAGLPLPPSHAERKRLMLACKGRYHTCQNREQILRFHRQLIDSGLISAR